MALDDFTPKVFSVLPFSIILLLLLLKADDVYWSPETSSSWQDQCHVFGLCWCCINLYYLICLIQKAGLWLIKDRDWDLFSIFAKALSCSSDLWCFLLTPSCSNMAKVFVFKVMCLPKWQSVWSIMFTERYLNELGSFGPSSLLTKS